jgi:hypothetical protein
VQEEYLVQWKTSTALLPSKAPCSWHTIDFLKGTPRGFPDENRPVVESALYHVQEYLDNFYLDEERHGHRFVNVKLANEAQTAQRDQRPKQVVVRFDISAVRIRCAYRQAHIQL